MLRFTSLTNMHGNTHFGSHHDYTSLGNMIGYTCAGNINDYTSVGFSLKPRQYVQLYKSRQPSYLLEFQQWAW